MGPVSLDNLLLLTLRIKILNFVSDSENCHWFPCHHLVMWLDWLRCSPELMVVASPYFSHPYYLQEERAPVLTLCWDSARGGAIELCHVSMVVPVEAS